MNNFIFYPTVSVLHAHAPSLSHQSVNPWRTDLCAETLPSKLTRNQYRRLVLDVWRSKLRPRTRRRCQLWRNLRSLLTLITSEFIILFQTTPSFGFCLHLCSYICKLELHMQQGNDPHTCRKRTITLISL